MFKVIHTTPTKNAPGSLELRTAKGQLVAVVCVTAWGLSILSPHFKPTGQDPRETRVDFNEEMAVLQIDLRTDEQIRNRVIKTR